jgi:hypothetical protein
VKKRVNLFGVIGGGFLGFVDFLDLGETAGACGGEDGMVGVPCLIFPPLVILTWSCTLI